MRKASTILHHTMSFFGKIRYCIKTFIAKHTLRLKGLPKP